MFIKCKNISEMYDAMEFQIVQELRISGWKMISDK